MKASCIRRDNGRKHVYHQLVNSAIHEFLDILPLVDHINGVGLDSSRPACPKASRPSTALSPLAGPRAGGMCIFPTFMIDRQRELRCSGHSTAARSAAMQSSVVSLLLEVRKCLAQTRSATPWSAGHCPFRYVGLLSKRSSQFTRRSRKHWKCDALHTRSII
jgi:hypothetical protein